MDKDHSNAFTVWKQLGAPQDPTPQQYAELEDACQLTTLNEPDDIRIAGEAAQLTFELPRAGVSLPTIEWPIEQP